MYSSLFSISITKLQCPLLCVVTSAIYIIITTFTFILLLLITPQIVFILILIIIIVIIIINIVNIFIKINPPFSLSKLLKLWLSPQLPCSQGLNQLSRAQLRRSEIISNIWFVGFACSYAAIRITTGRARLYNQKWSHANSLHATWLIPLNAAPTTECEKKNN